MRKTRFTVGLAAAFCVALMANRGQAQVYYPRPQEPSGLFQPLIEPGHFDPDFQFFQPVDYDPFHGTREYNYGVFGGFERANLWVSRPEDQPSRHRGDFTWANRYELGYMTKENHGWLFTGWNVRGPGANNPFRVERLNRFNEDDEDLSPMLARRVPSNPLADELEIGDLTFPVQDRNNHFFDIELPPGEQLGRDYMLNNSLNIGRLSSFELNKTFRLQPYRNGGVLEPFAGVRHVRFRDITLNDTYLGPFDANFGTPLEPTLVVAETLIRERDIVDNTMFGGQLGFRYFHNMQRWQWSNETRFFALHNFQNQIESTLFQTTGYDGIGLGEEVVAERRQELNIYTHNQEFVYGIDVKTTAAFQVTRDFGLRVGFEYMHFFQGVWRGPIQFSNQDLILAGVTFGFEVNR